MTIVRPSHTYDRTKLPTLGYYTAIARLRAGKPAVVHGDGTSLWVLTHHRDFAVGFVGLLGNPRAVGEAFHITSDELLTWNQIYTLLARAAGAEPNLVHVPSEIIARFDPELGAGLLGDKAHSVIFDNSKIRSFVPDFAPAIPFAAGAAEIMAWYDADPARQVVDPALDRLMDALVAHMQAVSAALTTDPPTDASVPPRGSTSSARNMLTLAGSSKRAILVKLTGVLRRLD